MKYMYPLVLIICLMFSTSLIANDELKVAMIVEPPFTYLEEGELTGYNVEVAKVLAQRINLTPVFIECPFARCLSLLEQGQADLMIGLSRLPEREKQLIFLEPALSVQHKPLRLYTLASRNIRIKQFSDLDKLIVGTLRGAKYFSLFDNSDSIKKIELTSREQLANLLLKGRIDTFLGREESIRPLLTSQEYQDKIVLADYQHSDPVKSYIAISKNSHIKKYAEQLSTALSSLIESGIVEQLEAQYLLTRSKK